MEVDYLEITFDDASQLEFKIGDIIASKYLEKIDVDHNNRIIKLTVYELFLQEKKKVEIIEYPFENIVALKYCEGEGGI